MIKVILFDLDGTLLPLEQNEFVKMYFGTLAKKMTQYGYNPDKLVETIWTGTIAMTKNDGTKTNEDAFWEVMNKSFDKDCKVDLDKFDDYYRNEFAMVKSVCGYNPNASRVVSILKDRGLRLILATNPLFPSIATENRAIWAGLNPSDFELITTYEDSHYCKPNPNYYLEILGKLNVDPSECIMIGNDVSEDMIARELGMEVFLLTDCIINKNNVDIDIYPHGGFDELIEYLNEKTQG